MRSPNEVSHLFRLTLWLGAAAAGLFVLGALLLNMSSPEDTSREVGKWMLQLALVFAGSGVVGALVRSNELARNERQTWAALTQEVIHVRDVVQMSARSLGAQPTIANYGGQIANIAEAHQRLRTALASTQFRSDEPLRHTVAQMREFMVALTVEYETNFHRLDRQQRLDEAVLVEQISELARGGVAASIPEDLLAPGIAWELLCDADRLPYVNGLRTNFEGTSFRHAYNKAKGLLLEHAGIR